MICLEVENRTVISQFTMTKSSLIPPTLRHYVGAGNVGGTLTQRLRRIASVE